MRKMIVLIVFCLILITIVGNNQVDFAEAIKIELDGKEIEFDVSPQIYNGRTLVPLKAIFTALGLEVDWKNDTQSIVASNKHTVIGLSIGSKRATINGKEIFLDQEAIIVQGRTMVPVGFIAKAIGSDVKWNGEDRKVTIESGPPIAPEGMIAYEVEGRIYYVSENDYVNLNSILSQPYVRLVESPEFQSIKLLYDFGNIDKHHSEISIQYSSRTEEQRVRNFEVAVFDGFLQDNIIQSNYHVSAPILNGTGGIHKEVAEKFYELIGVYEESFKENEVNLSLVEVRKADFFSRLVQYRNKIITIEIENLKKTDFTTKEQVESYLETIYLEDENAKEYIYNELHELGYWSMIPNEYIKSVIYETVDFASSQVLLTWETGLNNNVLPADVNLKLEEINNHLREIDKLLGECGERIKKVEKEINNKNLTLSIGNAADSELEEILEERRELIDIRESELLKLQVLKQDKAENLKIFNEMKTLYGLEN